MYFEEIADKLLLISYDQDQCKSSLGLLNDERVGKGYNGEITDVICVLNQSTD
jgi:hypothetical protein